MSWLPTLVVILQIKLSFCEDPPPKTVHYWMPTIAWVEAIHNPAWLTTAFPRQIKGTEEQVPDPAVSPDFRLPEPPWVAYRYNNHMLESGRPYRSVSDYRFQRMYSGKRKRLDATATMGCYCTTVFKRLTPLATCAVLTSRHIVTTATSTELVLARYEESRTMENILGIWYRTTRGPKENGSFYATPARIHYHPHYNPPKFVNRSHPLPCVYDLALYTTTFNLIGWYLAPGTIFCERGGSSRREHGLGYPYPGQLVMLVGYQFIWAINRVPSPFYQYFVRTRGESLPICPKTEWGWFICVGGLFAKYGMDSGGALHLSQQRLNWRTDGFVGLNSFSMTLRSKSILHYYTVMDRHSVLDFLYSSYQGRLPYRYLDKRFFDTQFGTPKIKPWEWVWQHREYPIIPKGYYWYSKWFW